MPNPYKYTLKELDDLVDQWHNDNFMAYDLKDFIMWETKFTEQEFEYWMRTGALPRGTT